jgi:ribokinase
MNMDHHYRVEAILRDGEAPVEEYLQSPGGSAANTIYALGRLGISTRFLGAVGEDDYGRTLVADLSGAGVDTSYIAVKKGRPSGQVLALVDRSGHRSLYALPGANSHLSMDDIPRNYLSNTGCLHLSAFVGDEQLGLQRELTASLPHGVQLAFSPGALYADRGWGQVAPIVSRSNILFANRDEILQLTGTGLPEAAQRCLDAGCHMVVVTSGGADEVCAIYQKDKEHVVAPAFKAAQVKDSTGAGDAFAAGFLYGLLREGDTEECARLGEIMAVISLRGLGARSGLPSETELLLQRASLLL